MTRRRWIADDWDDTSASLKGEQAAHLIRVLRAQTGMECDMVAGDRVWRAVISGISGDAVRFALLSEVEAEPALRVTLLLSVFKFDRMEWVIEKATELGAERFIPLTARRSEKHLVQAAAARVERWRRVAREAAKQSRRSDVPVVEDPVSLKAAVRMRPAPPGLSSAPGGTGAFAYLVCRDAIGATETHCGKTGSLFCSGARRRMDRGGRSSLRGGKLAAGKFGSENPARRDGRHHRHGRGRCDACLKLRCRGNCGCFRPVLDAGAGNCRSPSTSLGAGSRLSGRRL